MLRLRKHIKIVSAVKALQGISLEFNRERYMQFAVRMAQGKALDEYYCG